jgi:putative spermidine/putrescine transport system substrate-binding protein
MKRVLLAVLGCFLLCGCKQHPKLVVVSYGGGTYQKSHIDAFEKPFEAKQNVRIEPVVWGAEYGRLQEMVNSQNVPWDVVEVTAAQFSRGSTDNLFQPLTKSLPSGTFEPLSDSARPTQLGVPNVYWSTVLAYKKAMFPNGEPKSWADFWDVEKFPGPRAMYDNPRAMLEFALLSSGIPREKLYPLDVNLAFARLDKIRPYVRLWWKDGTEPVNALLTGTVVMSPAWSGRIYASEQAQAEIGYTWAGAAHELDYWIIPKGSKNADLATDFIIFASSPEAMAKQAAASAYGPANKLAVSKVPEAIRHQLPTASENWAISFVIDSQWWSQHEAEVTARWLRWKNK